MPCRQTTSRGKARCAASFYEPPSTPPPPRTLRCVFFYTRRGMRPHSADKRPSHRLCSTKEGGGEFPALNFPPCPPETHTHTAFKIAMKSTRKKENPFTQKEKNRSEKNGCVTYLVKKLERASSPEKKKSRDPPTFFTLLINPQPLPHFFFPLTKLVLFVKLCSV